MVGVPAGRRRIRKVFDRDRVAWIEHHRRWIVELLPVLRQCRIGIVVPLQNPNIGIVRSAPRLDVHIADSSLVDSGPQIGLVNRERPHAGVRPRQVVGVVVGEVGTVSSARKLATTRPCALSALALGSDIHPWSLRLSIPWTMVWASAGPAIRSSHPASRPARRWSAAPLALRSSALPVALRSAALPAAWTRKTTGARGTRLPAPSTAVAWLAGRSSDVAGLPDRALCRFQLM